MQPHPYVNILPVLTARGRATRETELYVRESACDASDSLSLSLSLPLRLRIFSPFMGSITAKLLLFFLFFSLSPLKEQDRQGYVRVVSSNLSHLIVDDLKTTFQQYSKLSLFNIKPIDE